MIGSALHVRINHVLFVSVIMILFKCVCVCVCQMSLCRSVLVKDQVWCIRMFCPGCKAPTPSCSCLEPWPSPTLPGMVRQLSVINRLWHLISVTSSVQSLSHDVTSFQNTISGSKPCLLNMMQCACLMLFNGSIPDKTMVLNRVFVLTKPEHSWCYLQLIRIIVYSISSITL